MLITFSPIYFAPHHLLSARISLCKIQFARKTLNKPIIPLVVESFERGPPWKWQSTAIGLLLAGELYVDFTDISKEPQRLLDLKAMVDSQVSVSIYSYCGGAFVLRVSVYIYIYCLDIYAKLCCVNMHLSFACIFFTCISGARLVACRNDNGRSEL